MKRTISCGRRLGCRLWLSCFAAAGAMTARAASGIPVSGAAFHVDASDTSTMTIVRESGVDYVTKWCDADGGSRYASQSTTSGIDRPCLTQDNTLSRPFVDFGPGRYGTSGTAHAGALNWSWTDSSIREIFLVYSDHPQADLANGPFLLGAKSSYQFHRGGSGMLFNSTYASSNLKNGLIEVDGVSVAYDYALPSGFHIIHLRTTGVVTADRFGSDRDAYKLGAQRLAEAVIYDSVLSEENATLVYDYLKAKWFVPYAVLDIPDQRVTGGAAATPEIVVSNLTTGAVLAKGTDYSVAYSNNVYTGTAYAYVTGLGDYAGKNLRKSFNIIQTIEPSDYAYGMEITPAAGKVTSSFANFPVLVRLSSERQQGFVADECGEDGEGIRFALADGTLLPHDIDTWQANGECLVWVNLPTFAGDTSFYAHWGLKSGRAETPVGAGTAWPAYPGVWHMDEADTNETNRGCAGSLLDIRSSASANYAVDTANARVGRCKYMLSGFRAPDYDGTDYAVRRSFGISLWFKWTQFDGASWRNVISKGDYTDGAWYFYMDKSATKAGINGKGGALVGSSTLFSDVRTTWNHLTITCDGSCFRVYVNGVLKNSSSSVASRSDIVNTAKTLSFDGLGYADEIRLLKGCPSAAYIAADYAMQTDADFLSYGSISGHEVKFAVADVPDQLLCEGGCHPKPVVTDLDGNPLTENEDYSLAYDDVEAAGTGYVRVTGLNDYAGATLVKSFLIKGLYRVLPNVVEEGTGMTWSSPMSLTNALTQAAAASVACELWLAGAFSNAVAQTYAFTQSVTIRGGFAGTESAASERAAGAQSVIHAGYERSGLAFSNTQDVYLDGLCLSNCTTCLVKSGAGCVTASNCVFRTASQGASFTGASTATLTLTDCEFCYLDGSASWRGLYIKTFSRAYVERCSFHHIGWSTHWRGEIGPTLWCESAPITMRHSRFAACWAHGNQSTPYGLCRILSAASECRFENCIWTGNLVDTDNRTPSDMSQVYVSLAAQTTPCTFANCTFAYNKVGAYTGYPGGVYVVKGTAQVRNTIFFGNTVPANNTKPTSLYVASGASCYVTNSLFEADSDSHFKAADGGTLDVDRTSCVFGDPLFVTPLATGKAAVGTMDKGYTNDVHLLSSEGYFTNDGTEHTAEGTLSPAIDAGRKGDDYSLEPMPNGGRVNMGAYGNTAQASKSPAFELALGTPTIAFDPPYTQPTVTFTTGGTGIYSASAVVQVSTNGTDWVYVSDLMTAITNGATRTYTVPAYLLPVGSAWAKVTLTCNEQEVTVTSAATPVSGSLPPWYGKGGGANVIHVRPGACCKKDGTSWTDAYDDLYTAMRNLDATRSELWIAGTNYYVVTDRTPSFPAVTVRGGFTGTENAIADRQDGVRSQVDGKGLYGLGFSCTGAVLFERLDFANCTTCISDSSGASDFTVTNCNFRSSACGVYAVGKATADLTVRDCTFVGLNGDATARGVYGKSFRRIYVDDCTFEKLGTGYNYRYTVGPALYADAAPVTVRNCRFAACWSYGNQCTPDSGVALLSGTTSECAFTNCVFTGGYCYDTENRSYATCKTLIRISLGSAAAVCRFDRCTFAYNMTANSGWSGGLYVGKGDVYIRDSIFFGNRVHSSTTLPSDIYVLSAATCHVAYTAFESTNSAHCAAASGGTLEIDAATCPVIDPFFVTDATTGVAGLGNAAKSAAFDVHTLSPAGYWKNDGAFYTDAATVSSAIDAGDPDVDVLDEPVPNGGRLNLGAYAGTAHASMTYIIVPQVAGIDISFPGGITQPKCVVRMSSDKPTDVYSATVTILCYTGTVESAGMTFSTTYQNVANGQAITNVTPWCYAPGVPLTVKVTVSANGVEPFSETASATVEGQVSPYFGKGGGAGICHVRDGATGLADGSDWFNAYPGLHAAFTAIKYSGSSAFSEMWVCETNAVPVSLEKLIATADLVVRGGFAGTESRASERRVGARTLLDGGQTNELLRVENAAGRAVTLERFDIVKAYEHGVNKSGAGDLTLRDCRFLNNSYTSWKIDGRGAYIAGSGAARIVVTNCAFLGNGPLAGKRNYSYCKGNGHGIYVASCARATFDDCLFATNGMYGTTSTSSDSCAGTAIFASDTPVTVRRTKFVGNRGAVRDNGSVLGGTVRLSGSGCALSALTNCLFVGNSAYCGWGNTAGSYGGALVLTCGSSAATTDVMRCTFAYNYVDGTTSAGGINVYAGTANVKDCIFARNGVSGRTVSGVTTRKAADIDVKAAGVCNLSYTMLSTNDTTSCDAASGGVITKGEGVLYGDPLFGMDQKLSSYASNAGLPLCYASFLKLIDVHLRGKQGYLDEVTGREVYWRGEKSPALTAGDPATPRPFDPLPHAGGGNLGCYGNTPYATRSGGGVRAVVR